MVVIILDLSHPIAWLVRHVCSGVLSYFNVVAIQNSLDGFRNTPNVRNNSKTSRWFPSIRSTTSCNWFFEVGIRISPLNTTNTSDRPNVSVVQRASKSGFLSQKRKFSFIGKHMPNQPYSWAYEL